MELLQETISHVHPIWSNVFFYLFVGLCAILTILSIVMMKVYRKKTAEIKLLQQQQIGKIDIIRKEHAETLEKLRVEMLKREEERTRQWIESEKETLHVLNGVSTLLELDKRLSGTENEKILKLLDEIRKKTDNIEKMVSGVDNENSK